MFNTAKRALISNQKSVLSQARFKSSLPLKVPITLPNGVTYEQPTGLFINNEFVYPQQKKTLETISPSTEELITEVYQGSAEDVDIAVEAADDAFKNSGWATGDPMLRTRALAKLADLYEEHSETLAHIESLDNGKCISDARGDVKLAASCLRSAAGWADKISGELLETGDTHLNYTRREPIGVCGQIVAWNFPLLLLTWKLGPAAATGNTMVFKSAEATPLSALYVAQLSKEAGFPPGVINVVTGLGTTVGNRITEHPKISKISFTGSTAVGKHIMRSAAESLKKVTLELGGKSPNIVFNDADIPRTVQNIINGIFYNTGEVCCAGSRLYIQDGIYDDLMEALLKEVEGIKIGDPFDPSTRMGAQNSKAQFDKILKYIDIGKKEGAELVAGGERAGSKGFFVKPTIFAGVTEDMQVVQDEIFGPVVTVSKFSDVAQVIEWANDSNYGLAAGIHSNDVNNVLKVANSLKAGTVWCNTYNDFNASVPFGGYKQSGFGREMGKESLDSYTQTKAVRIALH
ncbi:aldehyde dehydrogenase (NAD(P)(+)) ald5 [Yamadazyma tenuis]|uniref:Aldehyde dehydrogenase domain-containing protein n=1 Tax=Candida tenuis (strain ATCC 10573 / BCRC 21748 / CBS 615 / JCM 9827 / NBRC 10315 / NRRL Y-1498 / VKM Y-70) TaxID=590646 RepID=G3AVZ5_CANTC|nr:uncharacterized protein CANTEDRAFT_117236 [Yamadazyma tenuis ATCC 10573]EGV66415.1 hypothetical protein CANTEDRAFT_117236 [Yamadazyma tenuis ATCC 10573]WEJ95470.1 aldehyde dehydrogenase (NAD(P)(+)) ald5 [Yamadazyma tenuis]